MGHFRGMLRVFKCLISNRTSNLCDPVSGFTAVNFRSTVCSDCQVEHHVTLSAMVFYVNKYLVLYVLPGHNGLVIVYILGFKTSRIVIHYSPWMGSV